MALTLSDVLKDPSRACRVLEDELVGISVDGLLEVRHGGIVIDITFPPPPELAAAGYGVERGRITIRPDGAMYAFPLGPRRPWKHRNPSRSGDTLRTWLPSCACGIPAIRECCAGSGMTGWSSTSLGYTGTCSSRSSTAAKVIGR